MSKEEQAAYDEALREIEDYRSSGRRTHLDLSDLGLTRVPPELCELTTLTWLRLANNQLIKLPPELGQLSALKHLYLENNQLTTLPPEIGQLTKLSELRLANNQLTTLPPELGQLTALTELYLHNNQLTTLPPELGQLTALRQYSFSNNPLQDPPLTVADQGIEAIRRYFADKAKSGSVLLWKSKLMLVGQGRIGKTELRHRLMKRPHGQAVSTEVVEIETVELPHPQKQGVTMELRCWDFGGQDIYHATHQFFLTGRSLFLFCFEAGKDWEAGKPYYWLDKIAAVAPDAPVLVVATKGDERSAPSLPWEELKKRYPQLVGDGPFTITTKEQNRKEEAGDGIAALLAAMQAVAADRKKLPLMGETLPKNWVQAMTAVANHPHDYYLKHDAFCKLLADAKVPKESHDTVARMLRDLGEILYYCDDGDAALRDWVIIKPTWVTHAAARILDSADVKAKDGILTQREMKSAWKEYTGPMQPVLLDLMEKYDLTYKIPDDREDQSLVVEKLPPAEATAPEKWETLSPAQDEASREMEMTFHLQSMQAGIPSWFIARKHYYTLRKHWLHGVYFGDDRAEPRHIALIRASTDPKSPKVELKVRGPFPQTFFAVMKEGLETSIRDRYPKLIQEQTIPCCCQDKKPGAKPCTHAFNFERLQERLAKRKATAECDVSQEDVSVAELLFGYDAPVDSTLKEIVARLKDLDDKMDDTAALIRQGFQYLFDDLQQREETHCPPLFVIWRAQRGKVFHVPMRMALVCQHPGEEHIACQVEEAYKIDALKAGLRKAAPLLKRVGTVLKYAKLTGLPMLKAWDEAVGDAVSNLQETLNEMLEDFEKVAEDGESPELLVREIDGGTGKLQEKQVAGAALREFRALLDKVDPEHRWHGLVKKKSNLTGSYLWVCEEHGKRTDYQR